MLGIGLVRNEAHDKIWTLLSSGNRISSKVYDRCIEMGIKPKVVDM